jgi:hypothetical protein
VLGHHHKPDHVEVVSTTNLLQRFQKHVTGASRSQKGLAPITTGSDEVKIALPIVPAQRTTRRLKHAQHYRRCCKHPRLRTPRKARGVRHPQLGHRTERKTSGSATLRYLLTQSGKRRHRAQTTKMVPHIYAGRKLLLVFCIFLTPPSRTHRARSGSPATRLCCWGGGMGHPHNEAGAEDRNGNSGGPSQGAHGGRCSPLVSMI